MEYKEQAAVVGQCREEVNSFPCFCIKSFSETLSNPRVRRTFTAVIGDVSSREEHCVNARLLGLDFTAYSLHLGHERHLALEVDHVGFVVRLSQLVDEGLVVCSISSDNVDFDSGLLDHEASQGRLADARRRADEHGGLRCCLSCNLGVGGFDLRECNFGRHRRAEFQTSQPVVQRAIMFDAVNETFCENTQSMKVSGSLLLGRTLRQQVYLYAILRALMR